MSRNFKPVLLAVLLAAPLATRPAAAQPAPSLIPTRDVAITYRTVGGPGQTITMDMAWLAAEGLLRVTVPGVGWSVADHRAGTGFIVIEEGRRIMDMPPRVLRGQLGPPPGSSFTREGGDRVAGQPCTNWRYAGAGQEGRICVTGDGVMLRSLLIPGPMGAPAGSGPGGGSAGLEATQLRFAAQDPARFRMPEGYARVQPRG